MKISYRIVNLALDPIEEFTPVLVLEHNETVVSEELYRDGGSYYIRILLRAYQG